MPWTMWRSSSEMRSVLLRRITREVNLVTEEIHDGALILLTHRLAAVLELIDRGVVSEEIEGVDNGYHGINLGEVTEGFPVLIGKGEGLRYGHGLGDAGGLDDEVVEAAFAGELADF